MAEHELVAAGGCSESLREGEMKSLLKCSRNPPVTQCWEVSGLKQHVPEPPELSPGPCFVSCSLCASGQTDRVATKTKNEAARSAYSAAVEVTSYGGSASLEQSMKKVIGKKGVSKDQNLSHP